MVTTDCLNIYLTLYTIRVNSAGALEAVKTKEEFVYSYQGGLVATTLGGMYAFPVADLAAGDFDGDGKTEIAVAFKTNITSVKAKGVQPSTSIRGNIGVAVYKWQNGTFKHETTYDTDTRWNFSESPIFNPDVTRSISWLKPVAADIDGDGKHEIALVISRWQFKKSSASINNPMYDGDVTLFLNFWSCAKGSINPSVKASSLNDGRGAFLRSPAFTTPTLQMSMYRST